MGRLCLGSAVAWCALMCRQDFGKQGVCELAGVLPHTGRDESSMQAGQEACAWPQPQVVGLTALPADLFACFWNSTSVSLFQRQNQTA